MSTSRLERSDPKAVTWSEPLVRGFLALIVSLVFLVFPNTTAPVIAFGFGVFAFWDGVFVIIHGRRNPLPTGGAWSTMILAGCVEVLIGLVAFVFASATAETIGLFIASSGFTAGILGVIAGFRMRSGVPRETSLIVLGGFTAIVGFVLFFVPLAVVVAQIWTVAAYGVVLGFGFISHGLRLRRKAQAAHAAE